MIIGRPNRPYKILSADGSLQLHDIDVRESFVSVVMQGLDVLSGGSFLLQVHTCKCSLPLGSFKSHPGSQAQYLVSYSVLHPYQPSNHISLYSISTLASLLFSQHPPTLQSTLPSSSIPPNYSNLPNSHLVHSEHFSQHHYHACLCSIPHWIPGVV